jgi:hypothetical protein
VWEGVLPALCVVIRFSPSPVPIIGVGPPSHPLLHIFPNHSTYLYDTKSVQSLFTWCLTHDWPWLLQLRNDIDFWSADYCQWTPINSEIRLIFKAGFYKHDSSRLGFYQTYLSFSESTTHTCRSQWPRGLRQEPPTFAWTLGSWVRIPFKVWMFVCVYSVFVLSCV